MVKLCRVCDNSRKAFNEGKGLLQVQGLQFNINYNVENASDIIIEGEKVGKLVKLQGVKTLVDIDDITNVTKENRKALKSGSIASAKGKLNNLEIDLTYNQEEKEFYATLNLIVVLY